MSEVPKVTIHLWQADAVVLFEWLMTVDLNAVPITPPSAAIPPGSARA